MSKKNILISFMLSLVICFNCAGYRRDVHAVAFAIPIVVGGEVVFELTAAAFAALAGAIVGMAITSDSGTVTDTEKIVSDFLVYDVVTNGSAHTVEMLEDTGFMVEVDDRGVSVVDVPGSRIGTFTGVYSDGEFYFEDLVQGNGDLSGGSPPDPEDPEGGDEGPGLGKRILAGFMAVGSGLGSIGASFYDYLHNSDTVEYVPGFNADIGTFEEIRMYYYGLQQDLAASYYSYIFDTDTRDPNFYSLPYRVSQYEFYDLFTYVKPVGEGNYLQDSTVLFFACLCYNSDGSYCIISNSINNYSDISHFSSSTRLSGDNYISCYDTPLNFGYNNNRLYYSLSQLQQVAHFVNSDVTDSSVDSSSSIDTLKIGDTVYNIEEGDNIYNNPEYITQQITDKQDSNGNVLITAPTIDRENDTITYPRYVTYEGDEIVYGDTITYLNPDTMEVEDDVQLSDEDYTNKNIFQLLYNFCNNFWTKFKQSVTDVFKTLFIPDLSSFYSIYDEILLKFPIIDQVSVLIDKLLDFDYSSDDPPAFLIIYQTAALDYTTEEQPLIDFNGIKDYISILHGIILFICYFAFCKKISSKITKVFQP